MLVVVKNKKKYKLPSWEALRRLHPRSHLNFRSDYESITELGHRGSGGLMCDKIHA
jgi:hypothetical protein